jgi:hypothetical protein
MIKREASLFSRFPLPQPRKAAASANPFCRRPWPYGALLVNQTSYNPVTRHRYDAQTQLLRNDAATSSDRRAHSRHTS